MIVDIHLSAAAEPWPSLRDGVLAAEAAGFATAWVFDHFSGSVLGGTMMIECFTLLGALAGVTTTIGLGSMVVNVATRAPAVTALSAASVQMISGGRFTLGLGAGAAPTGKWAVEHRLMGLGLEPTVARRHERLVKTLDEIDRWWAPQRPAELATFPVADPRPPVILGVNSTTLATIAGERCDGLNVRSTHPALDAVISAGRLAHARRDRPGRRPFDVSVWARLDVALADPDHPERRRWRALGVDRLVLVALQPHDPSAFAHFTSQATGRDGP